MKKFLLSVFAIGMVAFSHAQVFYSENFSNQSLPGWSIANLSGSAVVWLWSNDSVSAGQYAGAFEYAGATNGHIRVDSDNSGASGTPENTIITSSKINCSGKPAVVLSFVEYYRHYASDTGQVFISNDSVNWTLVHTSGVGLATNDGSDNPNFVRFSISPQAAGFDSVYIRFKWQGEYDYYWFIDDVQLSVPDQSDAVAAELVTTLSNGCQLSATEPIQLTITNNGIDGIDTIMAYYQVNGGAVISEEVVIPPSILFGESYPHTFAATADFSAANTYLISAWVDFPNDTTTTNDTAFSISVSATSSTIPYTMGFEIPDAGTEIGGFTWTTEDVNADDYGWFFSGSDPHGGQVHYSYLYNTDGQTSADDWLFSPCLTLDAAKAYKLSFFAEVGEDNNGLYEELLEAKLGTTNSSTAMTQNIFDFGVLNNSSYDEKKAAFKPTASGTHYIGLHCYSDPDKWFLNIDDVSVTELAPPTASFTTNMSGSNVTVIDASDELINKWVWYWGDGDSTLGQVPGAHNYDNPGTYTVCLFVTNLAGTDSTCNTITISGIDEADVSAQVSVFPNPTNRVLNVAMGDGFANGGVIEIVNLLGETVMVKKTTINSIEKFDLNRMAQGVYYVRISSDEFKAVKKFVYTK